MLSSSTSVGAPSIAAHLLVLLLLSVLTACGRWADDEGYHPPGYAAAEAHGLESNLKEQVCVNCHAPDLRGDPEIDAVSCDGCHHEEGEDPEAWRSDCTFCHGGLDDLTGAPPEDLHSAPVDASFGPHTAHVSGTAVRIPLPCSDCHVMPEDVLSIGHLYDSTAGVAEVDFSASISTETIWTDGTCSNAWCHGDGQGHNGVIESDQTDLGCTSCHAGQVDAPGAWAALSGTHSEPHLSGVDGIISTCSDCHSSTVATDDTRIIGPERHIDGLSDVEFDQSDPLIDLTYDAQTKTCTGSCHGILHNLDGWYYTGNPHPKGYAVSFAHGLDAKLDVLTEGLQCMDCHGETLSGELGNGTSCDSCHHEKDEDPEAWRSDCTFCHGGQDNLTGAPPEDLHDAPVDSAFGPHTAHVSGTAIRTPLTCSECHVMPQDVLSVGHLWDGTAGIAETDFSASISPQTVWNNGTCSDSYCHGNGRGHNGVIASDQTDLGCTSCHAGQESRQDWWGMSGTHADPHLWGDDGIVATCSDCHSGVVAANDLTLISPSDHINGTADVLLDSSDPQINMTYNANSKTCTGNCHGERHGNEYWYDD